MNQDPRISDTLRAIAAGIGISFLLFFLFSATAGATQPECTGDRHYDEAGQCCPVQPEECEVCEPALPCPPTPACPTVRVECEDGEDGTTQYVFVDRCPAPEVSEVCKVRRDGTVVCPRSKKARRHGNGARRILVPQSIIDRIADVKGY